MALGAQLLPEENVLRHILPDKVNGDQIHWRAFKPTSDLLLSVDREEITTVAAAVERLRQELAKKNQKPPSGVCMLSVVEISHVGLKTLADPINDGEYPNPAHASIDFRSIEENEKRNDFIKLLHAAAKLIWKEP